MILPYLYIFLVFPVILGILTVDLDGNIISFSEYIRDRLAPLDIVNVKEVVQTTE